MEARRRWIFLLLTTHRRSDPSEINNMTKKQRILRDIADIERAYDRLAEAAELARKASILDFEGEFLDSNKCLIWDLVNVIDPSECLADYLRYRKTTTDQVADAILAWRAENER